MSLKNLKTQRRSVKSSITRMNNWITSQSTVTNETAFMNECINRRDKLEKYFLQYENIQGQIEMLIENSQDELSDNEDIDLVEKKYFTTNSELSRMIDELTSNDNSNSQSQTNNNCNIDVKLPDISLPKFKGQTSEWPSFIQLFENLIISNNSLTNIKKLLYLKASLSNEPLQLIDDLELCDDNFQIAIDTLKQRYDDQSVLLYNLIDQIYQQKPVSKTCPTLLREITAKIIYHSNVYTTNGQHPHTKSINNRNNNFNRQIDENSHSHQATDNRQNPSRPQKNYDNAETNENSQDNNSNVSAIQTQSLSALSTECHVLLATAKIIMYDSHNNPFKTTILLDNGSQNSFVSQELVNKLQLKTFEKKNTANFRHITNSINHK
ncbi:phosphatidylinositol 3-kinase 3-like [Diorhabda sublineata]|uniref:phosphatidylinositol 3-kinase 3-like n=1 Tax=Diorhabda sublineata TaxID=1163346 RepID=UPI0024E05920|nr:phosphatidylinositol 3-kinase 3-like [Diorhabda sublineata]